MKGTILDFSIPESSGVITGDDGNRYRFEAREWRSQAAQPRPGLRVDYVDAEGSATEVYVDPGAPSTGGRWSASGTSAGLAQQGLDERYGGLYRSSDEGVLLGLCAGLAHKFDAPLWVIRVAMIIAAFFVFGFLYFLALFLPKLPTRGVPHPN